MSGVGEGDDRDGREKGRERETGMRERKIERAAGAGERER